MKQIALPMIALTTSLFASDDMRMRNLENRLTTLEDTQCCNLMVNPPARPYTPDCWGIILQIDPLIWQANVNGLGVATQTSNGDSFFMSGKNQVKNLNFDWDFGFRLGVGLDTTHDAWEVQVVWTRYRTSAKQSFSASEYEANFPAWGSPATVDSFTPLSVSSKWEMKYDLLDLENGKEFYVSKCITLKPFAGLRSAWIKQNFDTKYRDMLQDGTSYFVNQSDRFWGIGIRGGLDMQWGFSRCFSIFSNYSGNLLYAYHSIKHNENPDTETLFLSDFHHVGAAIFDMQIGFRYDWISCDECYHIGLELGWENHYHGGQNQFIKLVDEVMPGKFVQNGGDLGIHGFFFSTRFDF